jgi:pimeloyl-[acyl-carrier protein] methyl ester esterase
MLTWVLLPGLDGIGRFRTLKAALAGRVPVQAVSYPPDLPLGYDALLEWVEAALPATAYCLVAESFSGPLAIRLAAKRPVGLRALVLAAGFCSCPLSMPLRLVVPLLRGRLLSRPPPVWLAKFFFLGREATPDLLADLAASSRLVRPEVLACRLREILRVDVCDALAAVTVPMLYLGARHDRLVWPAVAEAMRRVAPQLSVCMLPAPHMLLQTHPHEAARAIAAFLARHGLEQPLL